MPKVFFVFLAILVLSFPVLTQARITPEDQVNAKRETYEQRVKNYSKENQQKLEDLSLKISETNKRFADNLEQNLQRQGQILDEYVRRNNIQEDGGKDGVHRNLFNKVANARYWLTFAHEAVAYQAAKVYIFNLTSEKNLKSDAINLISQFQIDLNSIRAKVIKSQNILKEVLKD